MKTEKQTSTATQPSPSIQITLSISKIVRKFIAGSLIVVAALATAVGQPIEDGYTVLQIEIDLGSKVAFNKFNLAWEFAPGQDPSFHSHGSSVHQARIPLYSSNPHQPGLFNILASNASWLEAPEADGSAPEEPGKAKRVLATLVVLGFVGGIAYTQYKEGGCPKPTYQGCDYIGYWLD